MERESCCDAIIKATEAVDTHGKAIDGLTKLYKPVWGLCILFLFVGWLMIGFWQDVRVSNAALNDFKGFSSRMLKTHEDQDNGEFSTLGREVADLKGQFKQILERLEEIKNDQKEILAWQREHQ
jgi:hypothetical protein